MRSKNTSTKVLRFVILAGFLLIVLWLGLKGWRIAQAARSLLAAQTQVETLMAEGLAQIDPNEAEALLLQVRQDVVTLKRETAVFMPLTPYLTWLPRVGPLMPAARPLMEMADAGTEAGVYALRGLKPTLALLQNDAPGTERIAALVQTLNSAKPDLQQTSQAFDRLVAARAALGDTSAFPAQLQTLLDRADPWLPVAQTGLQVAQIMPDIMGVSGQRRYLVIAQNEDEARPTGGFIAGAGLVVVENGRIVDLTFRDANLVDAWSDDLRTLTKPYGDPPLPIQQFLGLDLFLFRDANFWPDFPTSAEMAMELYSYGQDSGPLDGAIAIDQQFMQMLLQVIGPIDVATENVSINGSNVISAMREAWGIDEGETVREWIFDRKSFMATFAAAILQKIQTDFNTVDPLFLIHTLNEAIAQRHLQVYMRNANEAAVLYAVNWDGRLSNDSGQDLLMVVDTNMGYNKVNIHVDNAIRYHVNLATQQANLAVTYQHRGTDEGEPCYQGTPYTSDVTYIGRADTCYWNYMRVYAPAGSVLQESSRHLVPGTTMFNGQTWDETAVTVTDDPTGLAVFANFFLLPWGQQLATTFQYQLPPGIIHDEANEHIYRLMIYKQPGTRPQTIEIMVELPANAMLVSSTLTPTSVVGSAVSFVTNLETDMELMISYR
ncbi:MAG: DUF4012 domain-containing protein [Ardenticatenaceae bacterium]|nr:DUF4012 domain-containing protein [Ardenticatenaceae bacterium]